MSKSLLLNNNNIFEDIIFRSNDSILIEQYACFKNYRRILIKNESEGSSATNLTLLYQSKADSLDKILINKLKDYGTYKRSFEITWEDISDSLSPAEAAIEFTRYFDDEDYNYKYMALIIRPSYSCPKIIQIASENSIRAAINAKSFSMLYNLIWRDLDSLLDGVTTIYYSPAGELNNVAFSALYHESNKNNTLNYNYLIDKYTLHQLTTTRYLADGTLGESKPLKPRIALLGGINYDVIPEN